MLIAGNRARRFPNPILNRRHKWLQRYEDSRQRRAIDTGGHRPSKLKPHRDFVTAALKEKPYITLEALGQRLLAARGVKADTGMPSRFLRREGITLKKTLLARERDRSDASHRRVQWREYQSRIDPERLVFIAETWAKRARRPKDRARHDVDFIC